MNITPTQTMKIAEKLGKNIAEDFNFIPERGSVYIGRCDIQDTAQCIRFNPTDPAIVLEMIDYLRKQSTVVIETIEGECRVNYEYGSESLASCVIEAMLKQIEDK